MIELEYLINDPVGRKVIVFSKQNKSHAQTPLQDNEGIMVESFTHVSGQNRAELIQRIRASMRRENTVKNIIKFLNK
jgi:hypothetical protein